MPLWLETYLMMFVTRNMGPNLQFTQLKLSRHFRTTQGGTRQVAEGNRLQVPCGQ
jgi:hypothetical protein